MFDWMHRGKVERPMSEFHTEYMAAQKAKEESAQHILQQLKAEILALRKDGVYADDMYWVGWNMAIERAAVTLKLSTVKDIASKLLKLSAVK